MRRSLLKRDLRKKEESEPESEPENEPEIVSFNNTVELFRNFVDNRSLGRRAEVLQKTTPIRIVASSRCHRRHQRSNEDDTFEHLAKAKSRGAAFFSFSFEKSPISRSGHFRKFLIHILIGLVNTLTLC